MTVTKATAGLSRMSAASVDPTAQFRTLLIGAISRPFPTDGVISTPGRERFIDRRRGPPFPSSALAGADQASLSLTAGVDRVKITYKYEQVRSRQTYFGSTRILGRDHKERLRYSGRIGKSRDADGGSEAECHAGSVALFSGQRLLLRAHADTYLMEFYHFPNGVLSLFRINPPGFLQPRVEHVNRPTTPRTASLYGLISLSITAAVPVRQTPWSIREPIASQQTAP
jgi:hypothetical protein